MTGELAHASVPDLKESVGGLRDATVLKALVASWLVDVPHGDLERCRLALLDVRDALHAVAGRATDRVAPEYWDGHRRACSGCPTATAAQRAHREARPPDHPPVPAGLAAGRGRAARAQPRPARGDPGSSASRRAWRSPSRRSCSTAAPTPAGDPLLLLRAAAEAAERDLVLAPATAARLVREGPPLPDPWPARRATCSSGCSPPGRACSACGRPSTRPARSTGCCRSGSGSGCCRTPRSCTASPSTGTSSRPASRRRRLIRRVARPDVLMVAALLHDIGKGQLDRALRGRGADRRATIADADRLRRARGRADRRRSSAGTCCCPRPPPPATPTTRRRSSSSPTRIGDREELELLAALTEADARATVARRRGPPGGPSLVARPRYAGSAAALADEPGARPTTAGRDRDPRAGARGPAAVSVVRLETASGRLAGSPWSPGTGSACSPTPPRCWRCRRSRSGRRGPGPRTASASRCGTSPRPSSTTRAAAAARGDRRRPARRRPSGCGRVAPVTLEPTVAVRPEASHDGHRARGARRRPAGLIHLVCAALAGLDVSVRSAHVSTLGPQAVDVFYVQEPRRRRALRGTGRVGRARRPAGAGPDRSRRGDERGAAAATLGRPVLTIRHPRNLHRVRHPLRPSLRRPSRTSAARAGCPRPTSTPPRARSGSRCSRPTSRCRWSRTSSRRSRSAPAAPRSARR